MEPLPNTPDNPKKLVRLTRKAKLKLYAEDVTKYAKAGCTIEQIAKILGVCERTLKYWLEDPEFRRHYDMGKQEALYQLQKTAYQLALEGDTTMIIFLLKTQCGWRERDREADNQAIAQNIAIYLPEKQNERQIETLNIVPIKQTNEP